MRKSKSSESQIVGVLKDAGSGVPVPTCSRIRRWRRGSGGWQAKAYRILERQITAAPTKPDDGEHGALIFGHFKFDSHLDFAHVGGGYPDGLPRWGVSAEADRLSQHRNEQFSLPG
jgi:hypothetical protein